MRSVVLLIMLFFIGIISTTLPLHADNYSNCAGLTSRLQPEQFARVTPGGANKVREQATVSSNHIGNLPAGAIFLVTGKPICADGYLWWSIHAPQGENYLYGWTAEGSGTDYWIEPLTIETVDCELIWASNVFASFVQDAAMRFDSPDIALHFSNCGIEINGTSLDYIKRANVFIKMQHYADAIADYDAAQGINSCCQAVIYKERAKLYMLLGELDAALADINSLTDSQLDYSSLVMRGELKLARGEHVAAESDFLAAIRMNNAVESVINADLAYFGWAKVYLYRQRYDKALPLLTSVLWENRYSNIDMRGTFLKIAEHIGETYDTLELYSQALGAYELYLVKAEEYGEPVNPQIQARVSQLHAENVPSFELYNFGVSDTSIDINNDAVFTVIEPAPTCMLAWSQDGQQVIANGWVYEAADIHQQPYYLADNLITSHVAIPNSDFFLITDRSGVALYEMKTGESIRLAERPRILAVSPDLRYFAVVDDFKDVMIYDITTRTLKHQYTLRPRREENASIALTFSPDSSLLAAAYSNPENNQHDNYIDVIDLTDGSRIRRIETWLNGIQPEFTPDSRAIIAIGRADIRQWDIKTGILTRSYSPQGSKPVLTLPIPSERPLYAVTSDSAIRLYNLASGSYEASVLLSQSTYANCMAFSPNGSTLAFITKDRFNSTSRLYVIQDIGTAIDAAQP